MSHTDDQPLVSVIMPSYNSAASLGVAVASVLEQTLSRIEIIIVDDASSDTTTSVVEELAMRDARIRYLRQPRNSGPSAARNVALDVARGIWIAPVDADDEIHRDRLRSLYEAGQALSADLIADGVLFVGPNGARTPIESWRDHTTDHVPELVSVETLIDSDIPLNGRCSLGYLKPLIRRDFLRRYDLQYDEELRFAEDFNLYARALLCGARFLLQSESHYVYNQTPRSASRSEGTLPELARYALIGNEKLRNLGHQQNRLGLDSLLASHRLRWATVLWFNRLKAAKRVGDAREALHLLLHCPGGSMNMVAFVKDRLRVIRHHSRVESADVMPGTPRVLLHSSRTN